MENAKTHKPKLKRKIAMWVFGTLFAIIAGFYFIPNFPFGPYFLYTNMSKAEASETIPYARLADTSLELDYTPKFKPDADALKRFPGVRNCLVRSQAKADTPDLRLINWNRIRHEEDAEVCLWWIFLSLETQERAKAWMEFHGMGLYEPKVLTKGEDFGPSLSAKTNQWEGDQLRFPNSGPRLPFKHFWSARFYSAVWDTNSRFTYVNVRLTTK